MPGINHVHLGIVPGSRDAVDAFLADVLGYERIGLERFPGKNVYKAGDGTEVHLKEDPGHRRRAVNPDNGVPEGPHTAVYLDVELTEAEGRLTEAGLEYRIISRDDAGRPKVIFTQDPSGNSWELHRPRDASKPLAEKNG